MNTTVIDLIPDRIPDRIPTQRFGTQLRVETRKLVDTRSGRGLLALIVGTCVFAFTWFLTHSKYPVTFHRYSFGASTIVAYLVPLLTLLALTSEWTQRTALTTFTLSPRRGRVLSAKFVAAVFVSLVVLTIVLVLAVGATALGGMVRGHAEWFDMAGDIRSYVIIMLLQIVMAAAFAALASQTAVAMVAYFIAPTVWGAFSINVLGTSARWFDIFDAYGRLSSHAPLERFGQTLTSVAIWIVVPAVLGVRHSLRREIK